MSTVQHTKTDPPVAVSRNGAPQASNPKPDLDSPRLYLNRELGLLSFQYRVLEEAQDESNPLLERLKFLSIVGSNLDEFCMVRVGGLKKQIAVGVTDRAPDGRPPSEQLTAVRNGVHRLMETTHAYLLETLIPALAQEGVHIVNYDDLSKRDRDRMAAVFEADIFPMLTPLAVDSAHPFPHISNLSLNLAVLIQDDQGNERFARLKVPGTISRMMPVSQDIVGGKRRETYVWVEQVIAANLPTLFPGMKVLAAHPFRITRNADMVIQELEADDLLETMEEGVRQRRMGSVLRLTINSDMPPQVRSILLENLEVDREDRYEVDGPLGLSSLMEVYRGSQRIDLKEAPFLPFTAQRLKVEVREGDVFSAIREHNHLVHHPYDSFSPVVDFLFTAAKDPKVLAIKMTLYRVGSNSPVVNALLEARENGKQVAVLVELKARFDEEHNIGWAKELERKGVHVIYGVIGLKTHSKVALVVRKEEGEIRRYVHLSTGNYNAVTAHLYEDIGFFTTDKDIGADASDLFNFLTGYSNKLDYNKLLVAPINLRARMEELINREIEHQSAGGQGYMILKTNALVDQSIIKHLYRASRAGVKIDLIVRGICCLRPGIPGLSDNITVTSIVGRFLEHSRIYYFDNSGDEEVYLGSADLMPRNLNRRVEVVFPIEDKRLIRYLRDEVLSTYLRDNLKARRLRSDGTYCRVKPKKGQSEVSVQDALLKLRAIRARADKEHPWELS